MTRTRKAKGKDETGNGAGAGQGIAAVGAQRSGSVCLCRGPRSPSLRKTTPRGGRRGQHEGARRAAQPVAAEDHSEGDYRGCA